MHTSSRVKLKVTAEQWPGIVHLPEYRTYTQSGPYPTPTPLPQWYHTRASNSQGYDLLVKLFEWDPAKRLTARQALGHAWFKQEGGANTK